MSDLYVRNEDVPPPTLPASNAYRRVSRSDVLEWLGWEECEGCGGRWQSYPFPTRQICPNCLSGLVPPAQQIEVVARHLAQFMFDWADDAPYWPTDDLHIGDQRHDIRTDARAVLIAAMKAVSDD